MIVLALIIIGFSILDRSLYLGLFGGLFLAAGLATLWRIRPS
jgi:hypothetical protein